MPDIFLYENAFYSFRYNNLQFRIEDRCYGEDEEQNTEKVRKKKEKIFEVSFCSFLFLQS
jgi:hypothetical protein